MSSVTAAFTDRPSSRRRAIALAAITGYLIGSLPSADLAARLAAWHEGGVRLDLRERGTGNPGGLNATKMLGARWGLGVMSADIVKGALAALLGRRLSGDAGAYASGTGSVVGHCLPPWSRFRGGKGVATSTGTTLVCFPAYLPCDVALCAATLGLSRGKANLATYVASSTFVAASALWWRRGWRNLWGPAPSPWLPMYALATSALICWRFVTAPDLSAAEKARQVVTTEVAA